MNYTHSFEFITTPSVSSDTLLSFALKCVYFLSVKDLKRSIFVIRDSLLMVKLKYSTLQNIGLFSSLCSKLTLFKTSWQILRILAQLSPLGSYLPYLRAFQWGTPLSSTLRGNKNMTSQIWVLSAKFRYLIFDLSYFWYPIRYRVIQ